MSHVSCSSNNACSSSGSTKLHSAHAENVHVQSVVQTETQSKVSMENAKKITDLMSRLGSTHTQVDEYSRKRTEEISEAVSESIRKVVAETQSKVSMENTKKISDLMSRLGSTHLQVDEYSRRRTEEISEAVSESIRKVVAETQQHQQQLLADANLRTAELEYDFKIKIQEYVAKLDSEKAGLLAQLEKELNARQELILESARKRIDDLNEEANRLKMGVLREAQAQSSAKMNQITEQVVALGQEDATRRLASTTTTVITTKAAAASETRVEGSPVVVGLTATQVESSKSASGSSSYYESQRR
jgi:hypothetical protein